MNRLRPILLIAVVLLALGLVGGSLAAVSTTQAALLAPAAAGEIQIQSPAIRFNQAQANLPRGDTFPPSPPKTGAARLPASFSPQPGYFTAPLSLNKAGEWLGTAGVTAAISGGDFDGVTVYAPAVIEDDGEYRMYYTGIDALGRSQIGLATSPDGLAWTKSDGNPLLQGSEAFVRKAGPGDYVMWYNGPDGIYRAASADGLTWTADLTPVLQPTGEDSSWERDFVSDPSIVIDDSGTYWMFYEAGNFTTMGIAAVGAVTSDDGITWVRSRTAPVIAPGNAGDWDEMATVDPAAVYDQDGFKLWFSGISNGWTERVIGFATSADGEDWTKHPSNPVFLGDPGQWDDGQVSNQFVLPASSFAMWYSSNNQIGYVSSEDGLTWPRTLSAPVLTTGDPGVIASVNYAHDWVIARSAPHTTVTVTLNSTLPPSAGAPSNQVWMLRLGAG